MTIYNIKSYNILVMYIQLYKHNIALYITITGNHYSFLQTEQAIIVMIQSTHHIILISKTSRKSKHTLKLTSCSNVGTVFVSDCYLPSCNSRSCSINACCGFTMCHGKITGCLQVYEQCARIHKRRELLAITYRWLERMLNVRSVEYLNLRSMILCILI